MNFQKTNTKQIRFFVNEKVYEGVLYDTPAANSLYEQLPLELTFEDYNHIEKIAYLQNSLMIESDPEGFDPESGDLCLYAPWGILLSVLKKQSNWKEEK